MSPSVLTELVNKKLLVQNIKEYIDSTTVIYDRSIQLVAVRTLLMSIDGNYLLFEWNKTKLKNQLGFFVFNY